MRGRCAVNRNSAYDTPLSGSYVYSYDRDRRLTRVTFPSGKILTRTYEDAQLRSIITPEYTVNYTYEPCGSTVKSLTTGTETITYGHDGPLTTSVAQTGTVNQTVSLAYNSDFKAKTLTYAGAANAYTSMTTAIYSPARAAKRNSRRALSPAGPHHTAGRPRRRPPKKADAGLFSPTSARPMAASP